MLVPIPPLESRKSLSPGLRVSLLRNFAKETCAQCGGFCCGSAMQENNRRQVLGLLTDKDFRARFMEDISDVASNSGRFEKPDAKAVVETLIQAKLVDVINVNPEMEAKGIAEEFLGLLRDKFGLMRLFNCFFHAQTGCLAQEYRPPSCYHLQCSAQGLENFILSLTPFEFLLLNLIPASPEKILLQAEFMGRFKPFREQRIFLCDKPSLIAEEVQLRVSGKPGFAIHVADAQEAANPILRHNMIIDAEPLCIVAPWSETMVHFAGQLDSDVIDSGAKFATKLASGQVFVIN
ncbi:Uncharacterised protein [Candidatus Gugararchaeum adminiculabundum]|nr:Uncharacterised protein [Candidatus Gugararchaeum adminiculabundum]